MTTPARAPRICIFEHHAGIQLCIKALFDELGYEYKFFPASDDPRHRWRLSVNRLPGAGIWDWMDQRLYFLQRCFRSLFRRAPPLKSPAIVVIRALIWLREMCARAAGDDGAYLVRLAARLFMPSDRHFFRSHTSFYAPSCARNMRKFTASKVLERYLRDVDYLFCGFPPDDAIGILDIARKFGKKVILVAPHRFNLRANGRDDNEKIKKAVLALHEEGHIVGAADEYDWRYIRHYLGIRPRRLYLQAMHIPLRIPAPTRKSVLIGPLNAVHYGPESLRGFDSLDGEYKAWCERRRRRPQYDIRPVRDVYEWCELEDLQAHPAFILLPYNVFAISLLELYEMNVPCFAPSIEFLVRHWQLPDRVLWPLYLTEQAYRSMEPDADSDDSPNSYTEAAQRKWLPYGFLHQRENTVLFDDWDGLFAGLAELEDNGAEDLKRRMYEENKKSREDCLQAWRDLGLTRGAHPPRPETGGAS